jgi:hypothetical protein
MTMPRPTLIQTPAPSDRIEKVFVMKTSSKIAVLGLISFLAGCGRSEPGRVEGGAAAGAATGATVGLVGGPVGVAGGAVIGGGVGAVTGAATSPKQVNLGPPP